MAPARFLSANRVGATCRGLLLQRHLAELLGTGLGSRRLRHCVSNFQFNGADGGADVNGLHASNALLNVSIRFQVMQRELEISRALPSVGG
jgi:hypothetical protein